MGRVDRYPAGTFCWVDLVTADVDGAARFYTAVLGWDVEDRDGAAVGRIDGQDAAGIVPAGAATSGWRTYIAVTDPAETSRRAVELGATAGSDDGAIRDPQGAAVWLRATGAGAELVNEVGTWNWTELVTPDLDASGTFYSQLFGWSVDRSEGPIERRTFTMGDLLIAAAHLPQPGEPAAAEWQVSFRVADARAAATQVDALGGRVLLPPIEIPIGALTIVADPLGIPVMLSEFDRRFRGVDGS